MEVEVRVMELQVSLQVWKVQVLALEGPSLGKAAQPPPQGLEHDHAMALGL